LAVAALTVLAVLGSRSGREFRWLDFLFGAGGYTVVDGDTIRVAGVGPVRYIGVDSPERGDRYYDEASRYNRQLLARGRLSLSYDRDRYDRYGRTLAYVYVRGDEGGAVFVNEEMVRAGWASAFEVPPNTTFAPLFRRAEEEAKRAGRGMWAERPAEAED
jgi:micrococcal nuclease